MASFPLTQETAPQLERAGSSNDGVARAVPAPAAGQHQDAPAASDDSGSDNAQESFLELCPAADFSEIPERPEEPKDGIPLHVGYGEGGESVQISWDGPTWKTDRESACSVVEAARGDRQCFPRLSAAFSLERRWEEALSQYPIARLRFPGTPQSRIVFAAPPGPQIDLCQVGLRRFQTLLAIGRRSAPVGRSLNEAG